MTYKPFQRPFWANPAEWPMDRGSHIYLARAVNELGPVLCPDWTGDEGAAWIIPQPPVTDRRSVLALLSRDPSYSPDAEANEVGDYSRALMILADLNEAAQPLVNRFAAVTSALHRGIMDGQVKSFIRRPGGLEQIHEDGWFFEDWMRVFLDCQWAVHLGVVPVKYPIYLDRADFQSLIIALTPALITAPASNGQRTAVQKRLIAMMEANPYDRPGTKEEIREDLAKAGLVIGRDAFNDEWGSAIKKTGAVAWQRGGRPSAKPYGENHTDKSRDQ